ncbi:hypothetical protein [Pseudorhodoferax sp. Leaf274]|uniref:hypothetical protein n=1 Tax=Pseudorhodoferax sp. Leaf274 TaxID=1736318 RepID=UPI0012E1873D|nr:hypothetical protein [Pseudorhodoferax sp. Leaf274]
MRNFSPRIVLVATAIAASCAASASPVTDAVSQPQANARHAKYTLQPQDYQTAMSQMALPSRIADTGTDKSFRRQAAASSGPSEDLGTSSYAALAGLCIMAIIARRRSRNG